MLNSVTEILQSWSVAVGVAGSTVLVYMYARMYRCGEMAAHTTFSHRAGWTSGLWLRNTKKLHCVCVCVCIYIYRCWEMAAHTTFSPHTGWTSGLWLRNTNKQHYTVYIQVPRNDSTHYFLTRTSGFWIRNTIKQHYTDTVTDTTEALYLLCISTPSSHSTLVLSVAAFVVWRMLYDFLLFLSLWQILCWWTKMHGIKFQMQGQKQQQ